MQRVRLKHIHWMCTASMDRRRTSCGLTLCRARRWRRRAWKRRATSIQTDSNARQQRGKSKRSALPTSADTRAQIAPRAVLDLCGASLISWPAYTVRRCCAYGRTQDSVLSATMCSASSVPKPSARKGTRRRRASAMSQAELFVTRDV